MSPQRLQKRQQRIEGSLKDCMARLELLEQCQETLKLRQNFEQLEGVGTEEDEEPEDRHSNTHSEELNFEMGMTES